MATIELRASPKSAVSKIPIVGTPLEVAEVKNIPPQLLFRYASVKPSLQDHRSRPESPDAVSALPGVRPRRNSSGYECLLDKTITDSRRGMCQRPLGPLPLPGPLTLS